VYRQERNVDRLAQWRERPSSRLDFDLDREAFLPSSYQYNLYGMGFLIDAGYRWPIRMGLRRGQPSPRFARLLLAPYVIFPTIKAC
jgi:hypothetical protein